MLHRIAEEADESVGRSRLDSERLFVKEPGEPWLVVGRSVANQSDDAIGPAPLGPLQK